MSRAVPCVRWCVGHLERAAGPLRAASKNNVLRVTVVLVLMNWNVFAAKDIRQQMRASSKWQNMVGLSVEVAGCG